MVDIKSIENQIIRLENLKSALLNEFVISSVTKNYVEDNVENSDQGLKSKFLKHFKQVENIRHKMLEQIDNSILKLKEYILINRNQDMLKRNVKNKNLLTHEVNKLRKKITGLHQDDLNYR